MNFDFSPEQHALRAQLRRLFNDGPQLARAQLDAGSAFDGALWAQFCELGFTAASIPEELDGLGLGALELCVLAEEAGRTLAPLPLTSSVLHATEALKLAGGEVAHSWLPGLASGEVIGTVAFSEGSGVWDAVPRCEVKDGRLRGFKRSVADAAVADIAVVSARSEEDGQGFGWWLVQLKSSHVHLEPVESIDNLRGYSQVTFDAAPVRRIGAAGDGKRMTTRLLDMAAIFAAFEQVGAAQALLETTVDYAKTRRAFGALIGSQQAVKHRLADMYTKIELARGHCLFGAWALSTDSAQIPTAAAGARLAATDACTFAAEESIELHGGIGFTWESDCHLYYRRARSLALLLGNKQRWSDRLISSLVSSRSSSDTAN